MLLYFSEAKPAGLELKLFISLTKAEFAEPKAALYAVTGSESKIPSYVKAGLDKTFEPALKTNNKLNKIKFNFRIIVYLIIVNFLTVLFPFLSLIKIKYNPLANFFPSEFFASHTIFACPAPVANFAALSPVKV